MSFATIQSLLDTHLQTLTTLPPLQLENTRNIGKVNEPFCRATMLPARTTQLSVGVNGRNTLQGLYQIDLFYPQDGGTPVALAMADAVIAHLPRGLVLSSGQTFVHIQMSWREAGGRVEPFYQLPVVVQWSCIA